MLKRKFLFTAAAFAISAISSTAFAADDLKGASSTLLNINTIINEGAKKAENLFEANGSAAMSAAYSLGTNDYLGLAYVDTDYKVVLKIASRKTAEEGTSVTVPVAASLVNKYITLIPIYTAGDEKITAWECYTNFDAGIQMFMGDTGTKEYSASLIRNYTDNPYLSACTYVATATMTNGTTGIIDEIPTL